MRYLVPLALFFSMVLFLLIGLQKDPALVPSPLIGLPVPDFSLPTLNSNAETLTSKQLPKGPIILNVWASWCRACQVEHPLLTELAKRQYTKIIGINYKDDRKQGLAWLRAHGDPYELSLFDPKGSFGLDLGVYGVPETFLVNSEGIIEYKHVGPLTPEIVKKHIIPFLERKHSTAL